MSTPYESNGRSAQKSRTRAALVAAARDLIADGVTPTIEDAAAARFHLPLHCLPLLCQRAGAACRRAPEIIAESMLPADPPQDPAARLDAVVANFSAMILDTEAQQRTMLRLSLETDTDERNALPLRQGRAIAWIAEALHGLRKDLSAEQFRQLVLSIRATIGIEAIVWLVDVAGLARNDAVAHSHAGPRKHSSNGQPPTHPQRPRTRPTECGATTSFDPSPTRRTTSNSAAPAGGG